MFGGADKKAVVPCFYHDTWMFDMATKTWTLLETRGATPAKRYGHSFTNVSNRFILFGGYGLTGRLNDTWEFDLSDCCWRYVNIPSHSLPHRRTEHGASPFVHSGNPCLVIHGGRGGTGLLSDLWMLTFADVPTWKSLETGSISTPRSRRPHVSSHYPRSRHAHTLAVLPVLPGSSMLRLLVFAGLASEARPLSDVWLLNIHSKSDDLSSPVTERFEEPTPRLEERSSRLEEVSTLVLTSPLSQSLNELSNVKSEVDVKYFDEKIAELKGHFDKEIESLRSEISNSGTSKVDLDEAVKNLKIDDKLNRVETLVSKDIASLNEQISALRPLKISMSDVLSEMMALKQSSQEPVFDDDKFPQQPVIEEEAEKVQEQEDEVVQQQQQEAVKELPLPVKKEVVEERKEVAPEPVKEKVVEEKSQVVPEVQRKLHQQYNAPEQQVSEPLPIKEEEPVPEQPKQMIQEPEEEGHREVDSEDIDIDSVSITHISDIQESEGDLYEVNSVDADNASTSRKSISGSEGATGLCRNMSTFSGHSKVSLDMLPEGASKVVSEDDLVARPDLLHLPDRCVAGIIGHLPQPFVQNLESLSLAHPSIAKRVLHSPHIAHGAACLRWGIDLVDEALSPFGSIGITAPNDPLELLSKWSRSESNWKNGRCTLRTFNSTSSHPISSIAISSMGVGGLVYSGSEGEPGEINVWAPMLSKDPVIKAETGLSEKNSGVTGLTVANSVSEYNLPIQPFVFCPEMVISTHKSGEAKFWVMEDQNTEDDMVQAGTNYLEKVKLKPVGSFALHHTDIQGMALRQDFSGKDLIATTAKDRTIRIWGMNSLFESPESISPLIVYSATRSQLALAFAPPYTDPLLASGGGDKIIKVYNLADPSNESPVCKLSGHAGRVRALSFIDGTLLVSGASDGCVALWDVRIGKAVAAFPDQHNGSIKAVSVRTGGYEVVSGSTDGAVCGWDVRGDPAKCLHVAKFDDAVSALDVGVSQVFAGGESGILKCFDYSVSHS
ncbi:hypothetical protein GEMRC1_003029 [Eukaryota sp. GEM-RC1]